MALLARGGSFLVLMLAVFLAGDGAQGRRLVEQSSAQSTPLLQTPEAEVNAARTLLTSLLGAQASSNASLLATLMPTGVDPCSPATLAADDAQAVALGGSCGPQPSDGGGLDSGVLSGFASLMGLAALVLLVRRVRDCMTAQRRREAQRAAGTAADGGPTLGGGGGAGAGSGGGSGIRGGSGYSSHGPPGPWRPRPRRSRHQHSHRRRLGPGGASAVPLYVVEFGPGEEVVWSVESAGPAAQGARQGAAQQQRDQAREDGTVVVVVVDVPPAAAASEREDGGAMGAAGVGGAGATGGAGVAEVAAAAAAAAFLSDGSPDSEALPLQHTAHPPDAVILQPDGWEVCLGCRLWYGPPYDAGVPFPAAVPTANHPSPSDDDALDGGRRSDGGNGMATTMATTAARRLQDGGGFLQRVRRSLEGRLHGRLSEDEASREQAPNTMAGGGGRGDGSGGSGSAAAAAMAAAAGMRAPEAGAGSAYPSGGRAGSGGLSRISSSGSVAGSSNGSSSGAHCPPEAGSATALGPFSGFASSSGQEQWQRLDRHEAAPAGDATAPVPAPAASGAPAAGQSEPADLAAPDDAHGDGPSDATRSARE
ncbi:hypothetical protein TSOC_000020 [Tetrabaena socialis]|uniref:Uncharacterized protein n=1 Tax=Tetrabaena socialis TaxID=47790 RepID=A0A2J8AKI1_9CHLO|nr:hypothetical protein TSOC_000020 [Tetrabaena socialis]|eukprot:PNH13015.1 hypothetical protein TSOC_000020 [Tetrabaena socialis]